MNRQERVLPGPGSTEVLAPGLDIADAPRVERPNPLAVALRIFEKKRSLFLERELEPRQVDLLLVRLDDGKVRIDGDVHGLRRRWGISDIDACLEVYSG